MGVRGLQENLANRHVRQAWRSCQAIWVEALIMNEEIPVANRPLTVEEEAAVAMLTAADLQAIDAAILANASNRWLKVARVIMRTEDALREHYPKLSYVFHAQRLIKLVEEGRLESQGNLAYMRFSEVRIPAID